MDRDVIQAVLSALEVPFDATQVLGIWPGEPPAAVEVHLSPPAFWRAVKRAAPAVTSTEHREHFFPHRHRFTRDGVDVVTYSLDPVLPPGVLTPGYALRLT